MPTKLPFFTLVLMISFASVNAVLYTPGLPAISQYFHINAHLTQLTVIAFLVAYAGGQLIYGPLANRYGRKPALTAGILLQIASSLVCASAGLIGNFWLLVFGRFILALGAGAGLKMTFTYVNEVYAPQTASKMISYLMLAFAVTPALAVASGGFLTEHWGWISCFYASAVYGVGLLILTRSLPETLINKDVNAFKINHLIHNYGQQVSNLTLLSGAALMGTATSFVYLFSALTPFIAIELYHMQSSTYGLANLIPAIGLVLGSLTNAYLTAYLSLIKLLRLGITLVAIGILLMVGAYFYNDNVLIIIFLPMIPIYCGLGFVLANSSTLALASSTDKAHAAALLNFINMGLATALVFIASEIHIEKNSLIKCFSLLICVLAFFNWLFSKKSA